MPSKGRVGQVKSIRVLPQARLFVPAAEFDDYRRVYGECVQAVPMSVRGITATRNWILDNTSERWVVFIDDDVTSQGVRVLLSNESLTLPLSSTVWQSVFAQLFCVCEDIGYPIWGIATQSATRSVYPYRPFLWQSYVTASCMGMLNLPTLRFDESYPVKEDYELCLRCIRDYGGVVAARFVFWENEHWDTPGGCHDYRTQEMEQAAIDRLVRMYPGLIRRVTRGGSRYSIDLEF